MRRDSALGLLFLFVLVAPFIAALIASGCDYGYLGVTGTYYWRQPVWRCYNVVVDYYWDSYYGVSRPVYQTVCGWYDLTPTGIGIRQTDVTGQYTADDRKLTKVSGDDLTEGTRVFITSEEEKHLFEVKVVYPSQSTPEAEAREALSHPV